MSAVYTVKKSFDLSGDLITNSLAGLKYCVMAKDHYEELDYLVKARITLLIHSCTSAILMDWNSPLKCIKDINRIVKAIDDFVFIVKNDNSFQNRMVNKTRKINEEYGIRVIHSPRSAIAQFSFVKRKRVFQGHVYFKEKRLSMFHSDSVYVFPIEDSCGVLKQTAVESGLTGLCNRLLNMRLALEDMLTYVSQHRT